MDRRRRSSLATGVMLILIGAGFLAIQLVPGLRAWIDINFSWPLLIVVVGVLLLAFGLAAGVPALAVPACVVGGIGGILYWQNATGDWGSWLYVWTLIPGFAGVGTIVSGLLGEKTSGSVIGGGWLILISLALFAIFGSFFGRLGWWGPYWPLFIVGLGLLIVVQALFGRR
jgi:hypothetical protein